MARRKRLRLENLIRTVEIRSFNIYMSARIEEPKSEHPRRHGDAWLDIRGVLNQPVKGQSEIRISLHEAKEENLGTRRPAVIGYVFGVKPEVHVVVTVDPKFFERAFDMALAGRLSHAHLSMTPPRYGNADVPSISFSNEPIE